MKKNSWIVILSLLLIFIASLNVSAATLKIGTDVFLDGKFIAIGDVNRDDKISARDALMILKSAAGLETYDEGFDQLAEVNNDRAINAEDALNVLKYASKSLPVEKVVDSYNFLRKSVKLSNVCCEENTAKIIRNYSDYVKFIDELVSSDENAFEGKAEEIKALYSEDDFDNYYYMLAVCVGTDKTDSVAPVITGVYRDNGLYRIKFDHDVPLDAHNGESSWCVFLRYSRYDTLSLGDYTIEVDYKYDEAISENLIGPIMTGTDTPGENGCEIIDNYEKYTEFINSFDSDSEIRIQAETVINETFFEENELAVATVYSETDSYEMNLTNIKIFEEQCTLYLEGLCPESDAEVNEIWYTLIPLEGKHWGDMDYEIDFTKYRVTGKADDAVSAIPTDSRLSGGDTENRIQVISTYADYLALVKSVNVRPYYYATVTGCTEKFFENNSLIVAYNYTTSGSHQIAYDHIEEVDGKYLLHLDYQENSGGGTDDIGYWISSIPVDGKDWESKTIEQVITRDWIPGSTFNVSVSKKYIHKINAGNDFEPSVVELKSYEEYVNYIDAKLVENPDFFDGKEATIKYLFNEADFEKNSVAAINLVAEGSSDYAITYQTFQYAGDDLYNYVFKAYSDGSNSQGKSNRCVFATVPYVVRGDYRLGVDIKYETAFDISTKDIIKIPVKTDKNEYYQKANVINTYEEYLAYLESIASYISEEYASVYNYEENYFNENSLVMIEYADESYSIDSVLTGITDYDGKYVFYITKNYPGILHEGIVHWNMLIPMEGKIQADKELSLSVNKTYTEGSRIKAKTMWASTYNAPASNIEAYPYYVIIPSYSVYSQYVKHVNTSRIHTVSSSFDEDRYNEEFFKDNVLLLAVIDGTDDPYDATVSTEVSRDGKITLNIDRFHRDKVGINGKMWNIFVPLEGRTWINADLDIEIEYTDSYQSAK